MLIAALAFFCLGDLLHAISMSGGEQSDHGGRLCGEHGCQTTASVSPLSVLVVTTTTTDLVVAPPLAPPLALDQAFGVRDDQIAPRAPRSPPLV